MGIKLHLNGETITTEYSKEECDALFLKSADLKITGGPGISVSKDNEISLKYDTFVPKKLREFLYEVEVGPTQQDLEYAIKHFEDNYHNKDVTTNDLPTGGCSCFRKDGFFGRNYDWYYDNNTSFIVKSNPGDGRYGSVGISSMSANLLGEQVVDKGGWHEAYKLIPFYMLDGINEKGVVCSLNVVPTGDYGKTTGTHPEKSGTSYCVFMLPKLILDNFATAAEAVNWLVNEAKVYGGYNKKVQIECHCMIADANETYIVEFINNVCKANLVTDYKIMTNFYYEGTTYDSNGRVNYNSVTPYGEGLERYNLIADQYNDIKTLKDVRNALESIKYTKAYDLTINPIWKTEFTGAWADKGSTKYPNLTVTDPISKYEECGMLDDAHEAFVHRSRATAETWQTVHSTAYDLTNKYFSLRVQEDPKDYRYSFANDGEVIDLVAGENIVIEDNKISAKFPWYTCDEDDPDPKIIPTEPIDPNLFVKKSQIDGLSITRCTQEEYDALPEKDPNMMYIIITRSS